MTSSDKRPQIDKVKKAARDRECDDDERFKERLGKLVKRRHVDGAKGDSK